MEIELWQNYGYGLWVSQFVAERLHVTERFTRTGADVLKWEVAIDDPGAWSKPWTAVIPLRPTNEFVVEYACHEGNYALEDILRGASTEQTAAERAGKATK